MPDKKKSGTTIKWLRSLRRRYRVHTLIAIVIATTGIYVALRLFPTLTSYISDQKIISLVTLYILFDVALAIDPTRDSAAHKFARNQDEAVGEIIEQVSNSRQVDLLEYAGSTTLPLIRAVAREKLPIRLLVKHPDTLDGLQKQRSIITLDTLYKSIFSNYTEKFEIRCYRLPYSLRARHLHGQVLELSWLTPDPAHSTAYGHGNPTAIVDVRGGKNGFLKEFFEKTFKDYWEHEGTEDGFSVLERSNRPNLIGAPVTR